MNSVMQVNGILLAAMIALGVFLFFLGIAVCFAIIQINKSLQDIRDVYLEYNKTHKANPQPQIDNQNQSE